MAGPVDVEPPKCYRTYSYVVAKINHYSYQYYKCKSPFESNGMMTFASTRCLGRAVSLLCMVWGRALEALALLMFVKDKNTAFNQSINIIEFAENGQA